MYRIIFLISVMIISNAVSQAPDCDRPPPRVRPDLCCEMPSYENNPTVMNAISKCADEFDKRPPPPPRDDKPMPPDNEGHHHGPFSPCLIECIFNETNILQNGEISKQNLQNIINDVVKDNDWKSVTNSALDKCLTEVNAKKSEINQNQMKCNPLSKIFVLCMHKNSFLNCPSKNWTDNADCKALKEHMTKCTSPFEQKFGFGGN